MPGCDARPQKNRTYQPQSGLKEHLFFWKRQGELDETLKPITIDGKINKIQTQYTVAEFQKTRRKESFV